MILFLFVNLVFGGARPCNETITSVYEDLDIETILLNIAVSIIDSDYDINTINEIIFSNDKEHNNEIFQVLSTIVSPVKEIHSILEKSTNCTKLLQQYGSIFLCLTIFTAALNLTGMFSVILAWKKCARYNFPIDPIPKPVKKSEESVTLISQKKTTV
jgi:hypothetical protein